MTFRPSDDVLDEIANGQSPSFSWEQYNISNQDEWQHIFNNQENYNTQEGLNNQENKWIFQNPWNESTNNIIINVPKEEVKAPDLSELLKNSWNKENEIENGSNDLWKSQIIDQSTQVTEIIENKPVSIDPNENERQAWITPTQEVAQISNIQKQPEVGEIQNDNTLENNQIEPKQPDYEDSNKLSDDERIKIVSSIEWSINSKLDYLVDKNWLSIIKKYKIINRLFFRWWIFVFAVIAGILGGILLQVKANNSNNIQMIKESSIDNKAKWIEETSDKKLSTLIDEGVDINIIVPYGSASADWETFQSKGNLIKYKWIILPQAISLDKSQDFISLEDFNAQKTTREDIKNMINLLIKSDSIYRRTANLPNIDVRTGKVFEWTLIEWFSLWCLDSNKVSDFVCNRFLETFNTYGKYFDLSQYAWEVLKLIKDIKKQGKDIEPICNMVEDYTLHAGVVSETLLSVMEYCWESYNSYKKMVNFIDLENSLGQPEVQDRVFEDPDLNAYKLLSIQQKVYKFLDGTSLNDNYIKSYLKFVQTLINKDNGKNYYLSPIYKDILYVFNTDELYQKLLQKWKLSSDLKTQIDQINNWNSLYWYASLLSQLTTPDIVEKNSSSTGKVVEEKTIEEIFSQYYAMTDRLKIRSANKVSEDKIKVQTEMFTDRIMNVTDGETLKVTVVLKREYNVLYVDSIKVANQPKLSEILSIYASEWDITFYAMMNYIDEQIAMRYESVPQDIEEQPSFCENLQGNNELSVYTCDDSTISLYKWDIEYNFELKEEVLDSFAIDDEDLNASIHDKLNWVMFTRENTPAIIMSIIDFNVEEKEDDDIEKKLAIIDQFRIHFKLVPDNIQSIEWNSDEFLIEFTLWEFELQAKYNLNTHALTKIYFANCEKPLEIRQLTIEITAENEPQLIEILNNPKVFFARENPTVYKKYQKVCWWNSKK